MFFEPQRSVGEKVFFVSSITKIDFPLHIHRAFEMIAQLTGETEVTVDGKTVNLTQGKAILVFPFQQHSYRCKKEGKLQLCLFSPDMVGEFYKSDCLPCENTFDFSAQYGMEFDNFYLKKAYVYSIVGAFDRQRKYISVQKNPDNVIVNLLMYAEENFCGRCILKDVAKKMGYDYAYISKLFRRKISMPFNAYVNALRINESKNKLINTDMTVTEIGFECGYSSLRSFNRAFFKQEKVTPTEYRKGKTTEQAKFYLE
ncbi:MAG: helix-turn-helix domain-containing protein [Clostridia bacterium]|nr:helix-turn-helix domain-containing protein [Clostridia bacterium]